MALLSPTEPPPAAVPPFSQILRRPVGDFSAIVGHVDKEAVLRPSAGSEFYLCCTVAVVAL
jgi:hypothetical protein